MINETQGFESAPPAKATATPASPPGFELLEELARGGMGIVYRARDTVLDREVALKVLQDRFATDAAAAHRFQAEARITGQLQHPSIPAIYQVGTLPDGRPFLAMKLIKGQTLERLLAERGEAPVERGELLSILEQTCQAVAYAHAHRVIHRDLKPSNIMVGAFGEVQVMDWGLAKVLGEAPTPPPPSPTGQTLAETEIRPMRGSQSSETEVGSMIGTPAFMPPEQAGGELDRITERADVFGLGGLLALILTGQPPYASDSAPALRLMAIRAQLGDCLARLDACGAEPAVVALCRQCLAPDPAQRPPDAAAVAQTIAALRADAEERARRAERERAAAEARAVEQLRKRRWQLTAAGVVAAALLAGVAGLSAYSRAQAQANAELTAANDRERQATRSAQAREAEIRAVLGFVEDKVFAAVRPKGRPGGLGHDVTLREALEGALAYVDQRFQHKPLIEARLRRTLGASFEFLGDNKKAADQFEAALAISERELGPAHRDTLRSRYHVASNYASLSRYTDALPLAEETLKQQQALLGPYDADVLQTMQVLARIYAGQGRNADALTLRERTLALQKEHLGPDAPDTVRTMINLAASYTDVGRHAEAIRLREDALALAKSELTAHHPETLRSMHNLAQSYAAVGRHAEALALREEVLGLQRAILGPSHPDTLKTAHNLVLSYMTYKRHSEAIKLGEENIALRKAKLGPTHQDTLRSMHVLANSYAFLGRENDALQLREETLALRKSTLGAEHPDTLRSMSALALSYNAVGRYADGLALQQETAALRAAKLGPDHFDTLMSETYVAGSLIKLNRHAEAMPILDACLPRALGKPGYERVVAGVMESRLKCYQKAKDVAGCRQTAESLEKLHATDANSLFTAARLRATTAALVAAVDRSPEGAAQAKAEADRAMVWLKQAVDAGFDNPALLTKTKEFAPLRDRPDFQALSAELAARPPRDKPPAPEAKTRNPDD